MHMLVTLILVYILDNGRRHMLSNGQTFQKKIEMLKKFRGNIPKTAKECRVSRS
jgi:hypothetical protein